MDARKIQTKIWTDSWFMDLSRASKVLFLYCLTNKNVNLTGIFECNDRVICFETGLIAGELETAKEELKGKIDFHKDWIRVRNQLRYDPIKGEKNNLWIAYEKQLEAIPEDIKKYFEDIDKGVVSPFGGASKPSEGTKGIGKGIGIGNKGGVGGKENLTENDLQEIATKYRVSVSSVKKIYDKLLNWCKAKGKNYKDYRAALSNWVQRTIEEKPDLIIREVNTGWKPEYAGMATGAVPLEDIQRRINAPCPTK